MRKCIVNMLLFVRIFFCRSEILRSWIVSISTISIAHDHNMRANFASCSRRYLVCANARSIMDSTKNFMLACHESTISVMNRISVWFIRYTYVVKLRRFFHIQITFLTYFVLSHPYNTLQSLERKK